MDTDTHTTNTFFEFYENTSWVPAFLNTVAVLCRVTAFDWTQRAGCVVCRRCKLNANISFVTRFSLITFTD